MCVIVKICVLLGLDYKFTVLSAWEVKLRGQTTTITLYISQHKQMFKLCQSMGGHFVMLYMMQIIFNPGHADLWTTHS